MHLLKLTVLLLFCQIQYGQSQDEIVIIPNQIGDDLYYDTIGRALYDIILQGASHRILQYRMRANPNFAVGDVYRDLTGHVRSTKEPGDVLFDPPLPWHILDLRLKFWRAENGYIRPHHYLIEKPQTNRVYHYRDTVTVDLFDDLFPHGDRYLIYYNPDKDPLFYVLGGAAELGGYGSWLTLRGPLAARQIVYRRMIRYNASYPVNLKSIRAKSALPLPADYYHFFVEHSDLSKSSLLVRVRRDAKFRPLLDQVEVIYYTNDPDFTGGDLNDLYEVKYILRTRYPSNDPKINYEEMEKPRIRKLSDEERHSLVYTYNPYFIEFTEMK